MNQQETTSRKPRMSNNNIFITNPNKLKLKSQKESQKQNITKTKNTNSSDNKKHYNQKSKHQDI